MSEAQRESFILKHVTLELHRTLTIQNSKSISTDLPDVWSTEFSAEEHPSLRQAVNVCGVMLPMYDRKSQVTSNFCSYCLVILFCQFLFNIQLSVLLELCLTQLAAKKDDCSHPSNNSLIALLLKNVFLVTNPLSLHASNSYSLQTQNCYA